MHASATGFAALTSTGDVLTFGSPLHPQVLGRTPTPSSPADIPSPVSYLGGIHIRKVAIGHWYAAALSKDNDLYVWGGQANEKQRINALPEPSGNEEVKLVDIEGGVDIVDVGVGSGHILALTSNGGLYAVGCGDYGQLGNGSEAYEEDWVKVAGEWESRGKVVEVGCGVWNTWIIVDTRVFQT